eukprot:COSAG06_NODE_1519_length_9208_cov_3.443957_12_plen_51_part_00
MVGYYMDAAAVAAASEGSAIATSREVAMAVKKLLLCYPFGLPLLHQACYH